MKPRFVLTRIKSVQGPGLAPDWIVVSSRLSNIAREASIIRHTFEEIQQDCTILTGTLYV